MPQHAFGPAAIAGRDHVNENNNFRMYADELNQDGSASVSYSDEVHEEEEESDEELLYDDRRLNFDGAVDDEVVDMFRVESDIIDPQQQLLLPQPATVAEKAPGSRLSLRQDMQNLQREWELRREARAGSTTESEAASGAKIPKMAMNGARKRPSDVVHDQPARKRAVLGDSWGLSRETEGRPSTSSEGQITEDELPTFVGDDVQSLFNRGEILTYLKSKDLAPAAPTHGALEESKSGDERVSDRDVAGQDAGQDAGESTKPTTKSQPVATATVPQTTLDGLRKLPVLGTEAFNPLVNSRSGRFYKTYISDAGTTTSAQGALIPDGYRKYPDPLTPFICPIRSCRKLFRGISSLGGHFTAGHRNGLLNDNGDGTFSITAWYRPPPGRSGSIIISHNEPDPDEGPMAVPAIPGYQKVSVPPKKPTPQRPAVKSGDRLQQTGNLTSKTPIPLPPLPSIRNMSSQPQTADGANSVRQYIIRITGPKFDWSKQYRQDLGDLLSLPQKRELSDETKRHVVSSKLNTPALRGLILYLTGDPNDEPCHKCASRKESFGFDECIGAPKTMDLRLASLFHGACANCHFKYMKWHQRVACSLRHDVAGDGQADGVEPVTDPASNNNTLLEPTYESDSQLPLGDTSAAAVNGHDGHGTVARRSLRGQHHRDGFYDIRRRQGGRRRQPPQPRHLFNATTSPNYNSGPDVSLVAPGQMMSGADTLEMEDWELAPGRLEDETLPAATVGGSEDEAAEARDAVAFSSSYLTARDTVPVAPGVGFNSVRLSPGAQQAWDAVDDALRLCSVAAGKVRVRMAGEGQQEFQVGPNGMFKIRPGAVATATNRLYVDAVVHITTIRDV